MGRTSRWLARLRHSRGFGVHSPFAYRFIREAIRDKSVYYDYDQLRDQDDKRLYRVAVFLQPNEIMAVGGGDARAAHIACPRLRAGRMAPRYVGDGQVTLVCAGPHSTPDELRQWLHSGAAVCYTHGPGDLPALLSAMDELEHGLLFTNQSTRSIALPFSGLPRQTISVNF